MKLNDLPKIDAALAPQAISTDVLLEKYAKGTESSAEDIHARVSLALAAVEQPAEKETWQARFLAALARGFIPGGRINSAGGTDIRATLINCFVQPVGDSVSEDVGGKPSIFKAKQFLCQPWRGIVQFRVQRIVRANAGISKIKPSPLCKSSA